MAGICTCGLVKRKKVGTRTVDGREVCNSCDRYVEASPLVDRPSTSVQVGGGGTRLDPQARVAAQAQDADRLIASAFWLGLVAGVVGFVIFVAAWPDTSGLNRDDDGSFVGAMFGLFLASVGEIAVFFAIIAWGVKFGTRAARG
jgi:hypothetical protein